MVPNSDFLFLIRGLHFCLLLPARRCGIQLFISSIPVAIRYALLSDQMDLAMDFPQTRSFYLKFFCPEIICLLEFTSAHPGKDIFNRAQISLPIWTAIFK